MSIRYFMSGAALVALTACGGGGDGGTSLPSSGLGDMTASSTELVTALQNFRSIQSAGLTSAAALPDSGTAQYGGAIVISPDLYPNGGVTTVTGVSFIDSTTPAFAGGGYIGEVELTASFAPTSRTLSGTASNFYGTTFNTTSGAVLTTTPVAGSLALSGSATDAQYPTTTGLSIGVNGTINGDAVTGSIPSVFFANAQGILGEGFETISIDGTANDVVMVAQPR